MSEFRTAERDSFWTWRNLMYDFLGKLTPDDMFVIARQLYIEMLLAGYSWVGEFHYVHHDPQGQPYADIAELSKAMVRAANDTGIGLCLLPVLYQRGGFQNEALSGGQLRFSLSLEQHQQIMDELSDQQHENFKLGVALHSLRAVDVAVGNELISTVGKDCPVHIHVAEQTQEIDDCMAAHGQRSVQFLLEQFDVDERWCLIHCTHLDDEELAGIAQRGAVVGLCPTTEANLGDGVFRAADFLDAAGRIAIGSDSHCSVDLREELRILEYAQRLQTRSRAVLGTEDKSVGRHLYEQAARNGGLALQVAAGSIAEGMRADFTLIEINHPAIAGANGDSILDRLVFCNSDDPIVGTVVAGECKMMDDSGFMELAQESQLAFVEVSRRLVAR